VGDPKSEQGLEEVERALSVLGGKHPERVRAEREAAEAAARRRREHEAKAAAERRRGQIRALVVCAIAGVLGLVGWQLVRVQAARSAVEAELAPLEARYLSMGFLPATRGMFASNQRLEIATAPGGCYALVATHHAQLRVERTTGSAGAPGEAVMCTCGSENVVVSVPAGSAVRALFVPGATFGGGRAMPYHFEADVPTLFAGGEPCADDALQGFARERRYPAQAADKTWLAAHPTLAGSGFSTLASAPARLPFVFVEAAGDAGRCFVAASTEAEDPLTLWALPDQKPLAGKAGAVGWCDAKPASYIVEHAGHGAVVVVAAASRRIGGIVGLREQLADAGLGGASVWLRDDERGALAADALRASVVPDPASVNGMAIEGPQAEAARVVAFSVGGTGSFVPDAMGAAAFECAPPLSDHTPDTVCVQTRGQSWRPPPVEVASGAAFGPLPFWMSAIQSVTDPARTGVELALVRLARRLTARGFEPTIIEGITEKATNVDILGRSGEDAIVAVGLWPAPPYAHPYSDGPAWSLADEPRVVPLKGGERVRLPVTAKGMPVPLEQRRTVVFRHAITSN